MVDTMIRVDLAKNVFQLHGATMTGELKFRRKLSRGQFLRFMAEEPTGLGGPGGMRRCQLLGP